MMKMLSFTKLIEILLVLTGSRADMTSGRDIPGSRASYRLAPAAPAPPSQDGGLSRIPSRLSTASAQQRLEIDELEALLKEKLKSGYYEVKKRFKDNDPEQKGNVSR